MGTLGAPAGRSGRRRRRPPAVPADPGAAALPLTRLTVITPHELGSPAEAASWLDAVSRDAGAAEARVAEALGLVNRALAAHRAASQDPYVHEVATTQAVAVRIGFGTGDEVADGHWSEAREISPSEPGRRRREALEPAARVAAVLGGRDEVLTCETLLLRARVDLDQGRTREAALQLRVGLEALLRELAAEPGPGVREDLATLEERRDEIVEAANEALRGGIGEGRVATLREALSRCERALRRHRVGS